jgi:hypothetical protein
MQSSVEQELQFGGNPSPQSIIDLVKHARNPSNSTARAISETYCPPASAKHVTCHLSFKGKKVRNTGSFTNTNLHVVASFNISPIQQNEKVRIKCSTIILQSQF